MVRFKTLARFASAIMLGLFLAIGLSGNAFAQCESGVCKLPGTVAKTVAKTVVQAPRAVAKQAVVVTQHRPVRAFIRTAFRVR